MRNGLLLIAALLACPVASLAGPFTSKGTQPVLAHPILPGGACQGATATTTRRARNSSRAQRGQAP